MQQQAKNSCCWQAVAPHLSKHPEVLVLLLAELCLWVPSLHPELKQEPLGQPRESECLSGGSGLIQWWRMCCQAQGRDTLPGWGAGATGGSENICETSLVSLPCPQKHRSSFCAGNTEMVPRPQITEGMNSLFLLFQEGAFALVFKSVHYPGQAVGTR